MPQSDAIRVSNDLEPTDAGGLPIFLSKKNVLDQGNWQFFDSGCDGEPHGVLRLQRKFRKRKERYGSGIMDWKPVLDNAQRLVAKGLQQAAADILEEYIAENEAEPVLLRMLGRVRMLQGRPAEAVQLLKRALQVHSDRSQGVSVSPAGEIASPDHATTAHAPDTGDDDDWTLIEATAAERRDRRHYFRPEAELIDKPDTFKSAESSTDSSPAPKPLEKSLQLEKSLPLPDPKSDIQPTRSEIPSEAVPESASPRGIPTPNQPESSPLPEVVGPTQAAFDFEFTDDDADDEEQRRFEENLEDVLDVADPADETVEEEEIDDELEAILEFPATEESGDVDWEEFALDADDFDEAPTREDLTEVQSVGRLTRWQRARQHAINLGQEFDWDEDGIAVLTEVFDRYWWSQAKKSMRRELQAGMRPEELILALRLREVWSDHPEFAMDFSRLNGHTKLETTRAVYRNLSWPMALALVRSTEGYPDVDVLEHFLWELFDEWYTHRSLRRRLKSFNLFLYVRFGMAKRELKEWPQWTFEPDECLGEALDEDFYPGFCTPEYRFLNRFGLIPQVFVTPRERKKTAESVDEQSPASKPESEEKEGEQPLPNRVVFEGNRMVSQSRATPAEVDA